MTCENVLDTNFCVLFILQFLRHNLEMCIVLDFIENAMCIVLDFIGNLSSAWKYPFKILILILKILNC